MLKNYKLFNCMNNKKLGVALLLIAVAFPVIGLAESSSSNGLVSDAVAILSSSSLSKKEARQNTKGEIKDIRIQAKNSIRATSKTISEKREALKIDLKKIKDERKSKIVENADKKLEKINDDRTNHLTDVLNQLEKTLAKINVRISAAQTKGIDVSSAKKASDDAAKEITSARTAVEAQAAKVYKMTITD